MFARQNDVGFGLIPSTILSTISDKVGEGARGAVFKAEWNGEPVAVKVIADNYLKSISEDAHEYSIYIETSIEQNQVLSALMEHPHPNVHTHYGYGNIQNPTSLVSTYFYVSELMPQGDLEKFILNNPHNPPMNTEKQLEMMHGVTRGILHIHEAGVTHCDLKDANIFLDAQLNPKIADFDLSNIRPSTGIKGTPEWMAPEILTLLQGNTKESDIYSEALILWSIIAWALPKREYADNFLKANAFFLTFYCTYPVELQHDPVPQQCPPNVARLITLGFCRNPQNRPTAAELEQGLANEVLTLRI